MNEQTPNDIVFDEHGAPLGVNWKAVLESWKQDAECVCDFPNVGHALKCAHYVA